jgi:iron(III) transport system substrate-binding protein
MSAIAGARPGRRSICLVAAGLLLAMAGCVRGGDELVIYSYVPRLIAEQGEGLKARNYYFRNGDSGAVIDVTGVAIHPSADSRKAAEDFVGYMLDTAAQQYFAQQTHEYPLSAGVSPSGDLPPMSELDPPHIDLAGLSDLEGTIALLRDAGVIP